MSEVGPTLYRFKTINTLKKVNLMYKKDIDEAKTFLLDFITEYEKQQFTDEMSEGIIKNLNEQQINGLTK